MGQQRKLHYPQSKISQVFCPALYLNSVPESAKMFSVENTEMTHILSPAYNSHVTNFCEKSPVHFATASSLTNSMSCRSCSHLCLRICHAAIARRQSNPSVMSLVPYCVDVVFIAPVDFDHIACEHSLYVEVADLKQLLYLALIIPSNRQVFQ